jgi:transposase
MADTASDKGLILALLEERDRLYQHNARLQSKLDELESADVKMTSYKQTIEERKLIIEKKERKIGQLEYQLQYLRRKYFGKSSEKFIISDPLQRKIDFEGFDILPQEEALAKEAQKQIIVYKIRRTIAKSNYKPVHRILPESLERKEERIRPAGVDEVNWKKNGEEITEILEHKPDKFYVRRIIREKWVLKNKMLNVEKEVAIAPMPFFL